MREAISKILLLISSVICIIFTLRIVFVAFDGVSDYAFLGGYIATHYGWEAVFNSFIWVFVIFVIPFAGYILFYAAKKTGTGKKAITVLALLAGFALSVVIPVSVAEQRYQSEKREFLKAGIESVNLYLTETFGEENAVNTLITPMKTAQGDVFGKKRLPQRYYAILIREKDASFEVVVERDNTVSSDFGRKVIEEKQLEDKIKKRYLEILSPLPPNLDINVGNATLNTDRYDFDYTDEQLLDKTDFIFYGIFITMERYDEFEAIRLIKDFYLNKFRLIESYSLYETFMAFNIKCRTDRFETSPYDWWVHGRVRVNDENTLELTFEPYTYEWGATIEGFTQVIEKE